MSGKREPTFGDGERAIGAFYIMLGTATLLFLLWAILSLGKAILQVVGLI